MLKGPQSGPAHLSCPCMIVGTGIDIADIDRIRAIMERFSVRFLRHILAPGEQIADIQPTFVAGRFAAKEACAKALGTGFVQGILPVQIAIVNSASGQPQLRLADLALSRARAIGARRWHVSISHERRFAIASVILED